MKLIFILSLILVFYTYLGYPLLLYFYYLLFPGRKKGYNPDYFPTVSFLIPCFNEEDFVLQKIENIAALEYPAEKIEFIFITDGSTDDTYSIVQQNFNSTTYKMILEHRDERKGKQHAIDRIIPELKSEIIIFNDCNTIVNEDAIKLMTRHFQLSNVGVVTGEKKVISNDKDEAVNSGEGMYWRYESFLKRMEGHFHTTIGSPGELFAIRKKLYESVPKDIAIEDFYLSMKIVLKSYRNIYEPGAIAREYGSASLGDEMKRKRRIASGAFTSMFRFPEIWKPRHWKTAFLYLSHRVFRWTLAPLGLLVMLLSNLFITEGVFFWLLLGQVLFYITALIGYLFHKRKIKFKIFFIPMYFLFMNYSLLLGFIDFCSNRKQVVWEKVERRHI